MNAIKLDGVTRGFGSRRVLRGVSAEAEAGKVIGLLGRNGEGKTTLFKIMLDMLEADAGTVELLGRRPDGSAALRGLVGWIPEKPSFPAEMSVEDVLGWRRRFFPTWNPARVDALCASLGLDRATKVGSASKGTLGKLAWVCAAAHEPELYLLDEPTSGLDALVREKLLDQLVAELHGAGRTILVASHRLEELAGLLDEVWVLSEGRIAAARPMEELRSGSRRVRARLKAGAEPPRVADAVALSREGALLEYAALGRDAATELSRSPALDAVEEAPLTVEELFKSMLTEDDHA